MSKNTVNVLLIEDNPGDARLVQETLAQVGGGRFHLECADTLTTGVERLARQPIDAVLLDLALPDSQGLDTVRRALEGAPGVAIVVLTSTDDDVLAAQALHAGAQDYLVKGSLDGDLLARTLRHAIERGHLVRELKQRNEELDSFTHSVSHDLKEPLRALEAFSQFLLEDCADRLDEQGRDYLMKIADASIRMKNLVDELLTLSRASRQPGPPSRVDVGGLVGEIIAGIQPVIDARGAALAVEKGLPDVIAEPAWLKEVFANLIGNAVKFNKSELPHVNIGVRAMDGGMATFYVQDNGIGIDPQYHERIFDMFERLNRREEYEGTGAGLAIVKRVLENLGGKVWVESELGAGATFLFTLPVWAEATASTEEQAA